MNNVYPEFSAQARAENARICPANVAVHGRRKTLLLNPRIRRIQT